MKQKSFNIILILILLLSFCLRIYKLDNKPVWSDEAISIAHAEKPITSYLLSPGLNYKPVYFILLKIWISLFGENAFNLRLFSLVWGMLAIFFIYKLSRYLFNEKIGIISAFLLGISVFHIFHCQQIRHFSFIVFLTMVSVYYFSRFIKENRTNYLFLLLIINVLIINTHPFGFSIIIFELIFAVCNLRQASLRHWFSANLVLYIFVASWLFLSNKTHLKELIWWIPKPDFNSLVETFNSFSWGGPRYGLDDFRIPALWLRPVCLLSFIYLVLFLLGLRMKGKNNRKEIFLLLLWLVSTIFLSFLLSQITASSVYSIKHLIIALPAFCIIVARGISFLGRKIKISVLIAMSLINMLPLRIMYNNYFPTDWEKSTRYLKNLVREDEVIIVSTLAEIVPFMYYFNEHKPSLRDIDIYGKITKSGYKSIFLNDNHILIIALIQTGFLDKNITTEEDFRKNVMENQFLKNKSIWVMISRWTGLTAKEYILDYLDKNFKKAGCQEFQGISVCYFNPLNKN